MFLPGGTFLMRKTVLVLLAVLMAASACASNDTAELDIGVETTTTLEAEPTVLVTTVDAEHEHGEDTHSHNEPVSVYPVVGPEEQNYPVPIPVEDYPIECSVEFAHSHTAMTDVHPEPFSECHTHTCEIGLHGPLFTYTGNRFPCPIADTEPSQPTSRPSGPVTEPEPTAPQRPEPVVTTAKPTAPQRPEPVVTTAKPTTVGTTTTTVEPSTTTGDTAATVTCGPWLVKLDEFVTETDNGCRTANCVYGRNATGHCRSAHEWRQAELERDCPTVDTSDGLGAMGEAVHNGLLPWPTFPKLVPGSSWVAEISLVDNRHWPPDGIMPDYFDNDSFTVSLGSHDGISLLWHWSLVRTGDVDGNWEVPFTVHEKALSDIELWVTAHGSGCWAVRFTPS